MKKSIASFCLATLLALTALLSASCQTDKRTGQLLQQADSLISWNQMGHRPKLLQTCNLLLETRSILEKRMPVWPLPKTRAKIPIPYPSMRF